MGDQVPSHVEDHLRLLPGEHRPVAELTRPAVVLFHLTGRQLGERPVAQGDPLFQAVEHAGRRLVAVQRDLEVLADDLDVPALVDVGVGGKEGGERADRMTGHLEVDRSCVARD